MSVCLETYGCDADVSARIEEVESAAVRRRTFLVLIVSGIVLSVALLAYGVVRDASALSAPQPLAEEIDLSMAQPSTLGIDSRSVFFSAQGASHIEPVTNCLVDGMRGIIQIEDGSQPACFRLVSDDPLAVAHVTTDKGIALRSSDDVVIPAGCGTPRYEMRFVHIEPPPTPTPEPETIRQPDPVQQPEPDYAASGAYQVVSETPYVEPGEGYVNVDYGYEPEPYYSAGYDWEAGYACASTGAPASGLYSWYGTDWYMAHSDTGYGQSIAGLQPGDQVAVNGNTVTIEGVSRAPIGVDAYGVYEEIGLDKTLFSTCCDDGSNEIRVFYGE